MSNTRSLPGPKVVLTAEEIWKSASELNKLDKIIKDGTTYLGPRVVAMAILECTKTPRSWAYEKGNDGRRAFTEAFINNKSKNNWSRQKPELFIQRLNKKLIREGKELRVPDDIFGVDFEEITEVHEACGYDLLDMPARMTHELDINDLAPSADRKTILKKITDSLYEFAQLEGQGIYILNGSPCDNKRIVFHDLFKRLDKEERDLIYLPCSGVGSYAYIVNQLYEAIFRKKAPQDLATQEITWKVENQLPNRDIVIALNYFEVSEPSIGSETAIRDQALIEIISMIVSRSARCCIYIGTTTSLDYRNNLVIDRLKHLAVNHWNVCDMPPLPPKEAVYLIDSNETISDKETVRAAYLDFIEKHIAAAPAPKTMVTLILIGAFCHIRCLLEKEKPYQNKQVPGFKNSLSSAIVRSDIKKAMELVINKMSEEDRLVIRLIAVCADGLSYKSLMFLLIKCGQSQDAAERLCEKVKKNAFFPLIKHSKNYTANQQDDEIYFDTYPTLRMILIKHWQVDDPAGELREFRKINHQIAALALAQHYDSPSANKQALASFRRLFQYYNHELASIDPSKLKLEHDYDKAQLISSAEIENLKNKILATVKTEAGVKAATEEEKFRYALHVYEYEIQKQDMHALSRIYAADHLKIESLMRTFYIGYLLPPAGSQLSGENQTLPRRLPFTPAAGKKNAREIRMERSRVIKKIKKTIEDTLEVTYGDELDIEDWVRRIKEKSNSMSINQRQYGKIFLHALLEVLEKANDAYRRDVLRDEREMADTWALHFFKEISYSALRISNENLFVSATDLGEWLSESLNNEEARNKFIYNRVQWKVWRGELAITEEESYRRLSDLHIELKGLIDEISEKEGDNSAQINRYKELCKFYFLIGGRFADVLAYRGNYTAAVNIYHRLFESSLKRPPTIIDKFTYKLSSLHDIFDDSKDVVFTSEYSRRNYVRLAIFLSRMEALSIHNDFINAVDTAALVQKSEKLLNQLNSNGVENLTEKEACWAIEKSSMLRFKSLDSSLSFEEKEKFIRSADHCLKDALKAARAGNISNLTRVKLLGVLAKQSWHKYHYLKDRQADPKEIGRAIRRLNRMIKLSDIWRMPLLQIDGLLLRAEILKATHYKGARDNTHKMVKKLFPDSNWEEDLTLAEELSKKVDYRMRLPVVEMLRSGQVALPCIQLIC